MSEKLFFFDVDGTLVTKDSEAAPSIAVRRALKALRQAGHMTFLCTGRTLCDIGPALRELCFDGIIAGAGTDVCFRGKQLYHRTIPLPLLRETVDRVIKAGVSGLFSGANCFYYAGRGSRVLPWAFPRLESGADVTPRMQIQKFSIYLDHIRELEPIRPFLTHHYELYLSEDEQFCELVERGQGKDTAARILCDYLGVSIGDTVCFGDSANDLSMFRATGFSVAMGNASDLVKRSADHVTDTVLNDGVASALVSLGYVPEGELL